MRHLAMALFLTSSVALAQTQPAAPPGGTVANPPAKPAPRGEPPPAAKGAAVPHGKSAPAAKEAAEPAEEAPPSASWSTIFSDLFNSGAMGEMIRGGIFMWPILALGILAAGVILERWRSLKMVATDTAALRSEVTEMLQADRVEEAMQRCDAQQGPVPAVLAVGLRKYLVLRRLKHDPAQIEDQVVRAMDDYGVHIVASLERHLPILATVSSAAPMLGFLGTVQGMVISFRDIVERMGQTNIVEAAARGINIALLTTVFGLIVGIPTFMAYNYFTSVINRYVLQVEESATELMESVTLKAALEKS